MCFESMAQVEFHFYFQRGAGTSILLLKKFFFNVHRGSEEE